MTEISSIGDKIKKLYHMFALLLKQSLMKIQKRSYDWLNIELLIDLSCDTVFQCLHCIKFASWQTIKIIRRSKLDSH